MMTAEAVAQLPLRELNKFRLWFSRFEMEAQNTSSESIALELTDVEFEADAEELADALAKHRAKPILPLSDCAISRADIYEDHP